MLKSIKISDKFALFDLKSMIDPKVFEPCFLDSLNELKSCRLCPRKCKTDRFAGKTGFCKSDASFNISSIVVHRGEEPVISGNNGICNVFFSRCNMQCKYCQNFQISRNDDMAISYKMELDEIVDKIIFILEKGVKALGFVSPSHFIPHTRIIIAALKRAGKNPIIVFNTNAYDAVQAIRQLEGMIDVYLPDFKYMDDKLADLYSHTPDYSLHASKAIIEMYRQKGSTLITGDYNYAESGLIIRHLVLPGHVENSISVLRFIASEISTNVHISLMSQYYPNNYVKNHPKLGRRITLSEYKMVIDEMDRLGFTRGWIQEIDSPDFYQPDFLKSNPFESNL